MEPIKTRMSGDIKYLKRKIYKNYLNTLPKVIIKALSDYVTVVYLTLYDLTAAGFWHLGTIIISNQVLNREIKKGEFGVKHTIDKLENQKFIEFKPKNHSDKNYLLENRNKRMHIFIIGAQLKNCFKQDRLNLEKIFNKLIVQQILINFVLSSVDIDCSFIVFKIFQSLLILGLDLHQQENATEFFYFC